MLMVANYDLGDTPCCQFICLIRPFFLICTSLHALNVLCGLSTKTGLPTLNKIAAVTCSPRELNCIVIRLQRLGGK